MDDIAKNKILVLGALGFGSYLSKTKSNEILELAVENEILDLDCGIGYGNGEARKIISQFQIASGVRFRIWEKIGLDFKAEGSVEFGYGSLKKVKFALASMLDTYRVDSIHKLQLHVPVAHTEVDFILDFLETSMKLKEIQNLGVSNHDEFELIEIANQLARRSLRLSSNQIHYNFAERRAEQGMIESSIKLEVPLFANRVFARGLLSHKNVTQSNRMKLSKKTQIQESKYSEYYESMKKCFSDNSERDLSEIALSWVLNRKGLEGVILGVSSLSQLDSAIRAIKNPEEVSVLSRIEASISDSELNTAKNLPSKLFDLNY